MKENTKGNMVALFTVLIWGTTFIATKGLLTEFSPLEILFTRFILGIAALFIACPKRLKGLSLKQEAMIAAAGFSGVTLYYLMENVALTLTYASNVGVLVSISPCITAIAAHIFLRGERLKGSFFAGFAIAITGIVLISFNGAQNLGLNPKGDILAVLACFAWAAYSVITRKIGTWNMNNIQITRSIFIYGTVFMLPFMAFYGYHADIRLLLKPQIALQFIYLGVGASAACFATWNYAIKTLGAVKTSIYIYLIPVITVIMSYFILGEKITAMSATGTVLTLLGLVVSEGRMDFAFSERKRI